MTDRMMFETPPCAECDLRPRCAAERLTCTAFRTWASRGRGARRLRIPLGTRLLAIDDLEPDAADSDRDAARA